MSTISQGLLAVVRLGEDRVVRCRRRASWRTRGREGVSSASTNATLAAGLRGAFATAAWSGSSCPRGLGAVDLHDTAARKAADAEGHVERGRPGRDDLDGGLFGRSPMRMTAPLPNWPFNLCERGVQGLLAVGFCHGFQPGLLDSIASVSANAMPLTMGLDAGPACGDNSGASPPKPPESPVRALPEPPEEWMFDFRVKRTTRHFRAYVPGPASQVVDADATPGAGTRGDTVADASASVSTRNPGGGK